MKTLIKVALKNRHQPAMRGILFYGREARAYSSDLEIHASTAGKWDFKQPTFVDARIVRAALAMGGKIPEWDGRSLNGVTLPKFGEPSNIPDQPDIADGFSIHGDSLADDIDGVLSACATSGIRFYLQGILFDIDAGVLCATDGHRLHAIYSALHKDKGRGQVIIRREVFGLVKTKLVAVSDKYATIYHEHGALITKLIDAKFPDYTRVIPKLETRPLAAPITDEMRTILRKTQMLNKATGRKFNYFMLDEDGVSRVSDNDGNNLAEWKFWPSECPQGKRGFQPNYLLDALKFVGDGDLRLGGSDDSAIVSGERRVAVVMPMRV